MKDATRFALAIAAILSATALDAQQARSSAGDGDDSLRATQAAADPSIDELDRAGVDAGRRISRDAEPRWIAHPTSP